MKRISECQAFKTNQHLSESLWSVPLKDKGLTVRTAPECRPCLHMPSAVGDTHRPPHAHPPALRFTHAHLMNFTEWLLSRSRKTTPRTPVLSRTQVNPHAYFLVPTVFLHRVPLLSPLSPPICFMKSHLSRALSPPSVHRPLQQPSPHTIPLLQLISVFLEPQTIRTRHIVGTRHVLVE